VAGGDEWPLFGRTDELELVYETLARSRGVVLSGTAGVGKSRLASAVVQEAANRGWQTVSVAAGSETVAVPFAPFAVLLGDDARGDALARFLRAERALTRRGKRVLLFVDDGHQLDEISLAFVRHVLAATDVRVLVTVRSGELVPSTLVSLWQSDVLRRIEVLALAPDETESLVRSVLDGDVDASVVRWIWETTRGNPLFVRELLLDARSRGALADTDGRWTITGAAPGAGSRLQEIVAARVGSLDDDERAAVELVALGEPLEMAMFEQLASAGVVGRLEQRSLLVTRNVRRRITVRLAHPLHGEVVRSTMSTTAARQHRRELIDGLLRTGARRADDDLRLAVWRCEVGDVRDWPALLGAAQQLSLAAKAPFVAGLTTGVTAVNTTSVRHLEQAILLARGAMEGGGSVTAAALLVRLLVQLGRLEEARRVHDALDDLAPDDDGLLAVALLKADIAMYGQGRPDAAMAILERFEADAGPVHRQSARTVRAAFTMLSGDPLEAAELAAAIVADDATGRDDRQTALAVLAGAHAELGQVATGLAVVEAALGDAQPDDSTESLGALILTRCMLLTYGGRLDEAAELMAICRDLAAAGGDDNGVGMFLQILAVVALVSGDATTALAVGDDAARLLVVQDVYGMGRNLLSTRVHAAALLGELDVARALLVELDAHEPRPMMFMADEMRARAWLDVAEGRTTAAVARMEAGAETFGAAGRVLREATMLHDLVRLGQARHAVARLEELAAASDSLVVALQALHARAAVAGDANRLTTVASRWASAGFHLFAAEAAAQAAAVHEHAGRSSSAATAGARSRESLALCPGVSTPALSLAGPAANLTRREKEITGLAAKGLSDREIAEALVVSIRTVNAHLYNAYSKLGIDGRADLPAALGG
jgi:DNA-binding CsgD family transcriptional regulator/type II secretory pathway predicted ATPase ExeA